MKTVVLSSNNNPDYFNYLPYVEKAWGMLGWNTLTYLVDMEGGGMAPHARISIPSSPAFRQDTFTQCVRLLAHHDIDSGTLMTSDIDMIPLSNYWSPNPAVWTVYGRDLTGHEHHPICYISGDKSLWAKTFPEESVTQLLGKYPQSSSSDFYRYWFTDQIIATERIVDYVSVERGTEAGLAKGRIDRADWAGTLARVSAGIDAHMVRPFSPDEAERCLAMLSANL